MKKFDPYLKLRTRMINEDRYMDMTLAEFGLYIWGLCHSNNELTDGFVSSTVLRRAGLDKEHAIATADSLVAKHGVWERVPNGYQIKDYADMARTRDAILLDVETKRAAKVEAGRKGGRKKASKAVADSAEKASRIMESLADASIRTQNTEHRTQEEGEKAVRPPSDIYLLVEFWKQQWEQTYGSPPLIPKKFASRPFGAAKVILEVLPLEDAKEAVKRAFADERTRAGKWLELHTIASNINKYASGGPVNSSGYIPDLKAW